MSLRISALRSLFLVLVSSFAHAAPRPATHVVCVGDSITEGAGASGASANYPSQLQRLLGDAVQVENFGRSGATLLSNGDLPYIQQQQYTAATNFVDNAGPGTVVSVIIVLGANDSKPFNWDGAGQPEKFLADYLALVEHFEGLSSQPTVYVALPLATGNSPCCEIRGDVILNDQVPLIEQVAEQLRVPLIDLNTPTTGHPEYFGDGVHPNDAGYVVMAELVKAGLEREPTASIEMPAMDAALSAGAIPVTVAVSGDTVDIASVEFFDGATSLGMETTPPFTFAWQATVGMHQLSIKATDTTLADVTSDLRSVTITDAEDQGTGGVGGASNEGGAAGADEGVAGGAGGSQDTAEEPGGQGGRAGAPGASMDDPALEPAGDVNPQIDAPVADPGAQPAPVEPVGTSTPVPSGSSSTSSAPTATGTAPSSATPSGNDGGCSISALSTATHRHGVWAALSLLLAVLSLRRHESSLCRSRSWSMAGRLVA